MVLLNKVGVVNNNQIKMLGEYHNYSKITDDTYREIYENVATYGINEGYYVNDKENGTTYWSTLNKYIKGSFDLYDLSATVTSRTATLSNIKTELTNHRPFYLTLYSHPEYGNHGVAGYAYTRLISETTGYYLSFLKIAGDRPMNISRYLKAIICFLLLIALFPLYGFSSYSDDQYIERTEWYDDAVTYCSENGLLTELLQQDDDNLDDGVTWVTLAQALSELAVNYSDEIYTSEVNWAKDFGLIKENVSENDIVSRFDAAKTFSTFISKSNVETNQPLSTSNFVDFLNIPASYQQDVLFVESTSLMNGYGNGTFGGNDPLTRCQLAQILYNGKDFFSNLSMSKIFSLSENDITCIDIQSGSTGDKKSITDADEILGIVNLLNNFEFNSIRIVEGDGWARRLILHFSSGEMFYFYISPSSITINNIIYESDIQYFPPTLL